MSEPIFPVQLQSFKEALKATGLLDSLVTETKHYGIEHTDNKVRILLRSPEVIHAVCKKYQVKDARVRIAFSAGNGFLEVGEDSSTLEVYGTDKVLLAEPTPLIWLEDAIALAVQVELLQLLLLNKGINIPLL